MRSINATCSIKYDENHEIEINLPEKRKYPDRKSFESITGIIWAVGGEEAKVHVRLPEPDGVIACEAGSQIAEEIAKILYHKARLSGRSVRDGLTDKIKEFEILSLDHSMGHRDEWKPEKIAERKYNAILSIQEMLADDMKDFDAESYIEEIRGE